MGKMRVILILVVIAIVAGVAFWYSSDKKALAPLNGSEDEIEAVIQPIEPELSVDEEGDASEEESLGGDIFNKTTNPVSGNLPDSVAPVPNPLDEAYVNPFE